VKLNIVATRDIKADVFSQPEFVHSLGSAIRAFGDACQDKERKDALGKHPEDFELYHLGWFGDGDAHFEILPKPQQIAVGSDYA